MQILSQRDPRWSALKLGSSSLTVGRYGCTTTCISMLSDYFKGLVLPSVLSAHKEFYTPQGLILWSKLVLPTMKFAGRFYGRDDVKIREALKNPDKAVILEVGNGSHWVAALKPTFFGNSYIVADPWTGDKCDVISRYKNITGAAYFIKK